MRITIVRDSRFSLIASTCDRYDDPIAQSGYAVLIGSRRIGISHATSDFDFCVYLPPASRVRLEADTFTSQGVEGPSAFGAYDGWGGIDAHGRMWSYKFYNDLNVVASINEDYNAVMQEYSPEQLLELRKRIPHKPSFYAYLGIRSALQVSAGLSRDDARCMPFACLRAHRGLKAADPSARMQAMYAYVEQVDTYRYLIARQDRGQS